MIHCHECGATRESVALSAEEMRIADPICCEMEPRPMVDAVSLLDWTRLGIELRSAALDAWDKLLTIDMSYSFLLENPECFGYQGWPDGMPAEPNIELIAAYYAVGVEAHQ